MDMTKGSSLRTYLGNPEFYDTNNGFRSIFDTSFTNQELLKCIGEHYGEQQWSKLKEELEEFEDALTDYMAADSVDCLSHLKSDCKYKVVEEFIDVLIVMSTILNTEDNVDMLALAEGIYEYKIKRQIFRIINEDEKLGAK